VKRLLDYGSAQSFQRRTGIDIYGLRINNVIEPHEYVEIFPAFMKDPDLRRRNIFSYIDARDLGQMVQKCLQTDGLGYQVFNVSNDDHSVGLTSEELIKTYYQDVPLKTNDTPKSFYSNEKAKRLLGFKPEYSWRDYIKP
jgi:nucleoside-diphosphate-sugar epimerase